MKQNFVIDEIKSGNRQTLENIYTMYRKSFIEWTTKTCRISSGEALDLYQQTILTLYENILSGKLTEITSSMKTYLFAIGKTRFMSSTGIKPGPGPYMLRYPIVKTLRVKTRNTPIDYLIYQKPA